MDVLLLMAMAACGALGTGIFVVLLGGAALTLLSARRKVEIARTYPEIGSSRVLMGALLLSFANNTVFSLLSYLLGRAVSLLF
jgi:hypothetical protein